MRAMAQQMIGAKQLIDDRGGYRVVARELNWPATTVHTFCRTDRAPKYRWDAIQALPVLDRGGDSSEDCVENADSVAPATSAADSESTVTS